MSCFRMFSFFLSCTGLYIIQKAFDTGDSNYCLQALCMSLPNLVTPEKVKGSVDFGNPWVLRVWVCPEMRVLPWNYQESIIFSWETATCGYSMARLHMALEFRWHWGIEPPWGKLVSSYYYIDIGKKIPDFFCMECGRGEESAAHNVGREPEHRQHLRCRTRAYSRVHLHVKTPMQVHVITRTEMRTNILTFIIMI